MNPQRLQLRRTAGYRKPEGAVSVVRGTEWGNVFRVGDVLDLGPALGGLTITRELAVALYAAYVTERGWLDQIRDELAGRDLACWCPLDGQPCYADWLLTVANGGRPDAGSECTCGVVDVTPRPGAPRQTVPGRTDPECPQHGDGSRP